MVRAKGSRRIRRSSRTCWWGRDGGLEAGGCSPAMAQSMAAGVNNSKGFLVKDWRREGVGYLHKLGAKLTRGLRRSGKNCGGGSAVDRVAGIGREGGGKGLPVMGLSRSLFIGPTWRG